MNESRVFLQLLQTTDRVCLKTQLISSGKRLGLAVLLDLNSANYSATGQWSHSPPVCQIKDCGYLTDPTHGHLVHTDGTIFGQSAYNSCSKGYTLNGTESRTCNELGNWTFKSPTCDVIRKFYLLALYIYIYNEKYIDHFHVRF